MKKFFSFLANVIEVYIPTLLFAAMFLMFLFQIIYRYIFKMQVPWQNEAITVAFSWTMILSAAHGTRTDAHVAFTSVYDALPRRGQLVLRLLAGLVQIACVLLIMQPSWKTMTFYSMVKTPMMKLPMNIYYFPFIIFISLTLVHLLVSFVQDCLRLAGREIPESGGDDQ